MHDGDDQDVTATRDAGDVVRATLCIFACRDDLAFGKGEIAFGTNGDDEVFRDPWVRQTEPTLTG